MIRAALSILALIALGSTVCLGAALLTGAI